MLRCHFQHTQRLPLSFNGSLPILLRIGRSILERQLFDGVPFLLIIFQDPDRAKYNNTSEIGRILLRHDVILINDTKGCLRVPSYGVQLMAAPGTVEVELFPIIDIADGDGIWIIVVSCKSKDAGRSPVQDSSGFFYRQRLFFSSQLTKHNVSS